ncbi:MAG: MoaD/ThiS family protein [Planctomycetes bacterium]|nr:MoaD/ThiS family protein [Planctomycetota bacterium]
MRVIVKLFAGARELAGQEEIAIELPPGATVGQLRERLAEDHTKLFPLLSHALFAIDAEYCDNEAPIPEFAEIACIPPVSGG